MSCIQVPHIQCYSCVDLQCCRVCNHKHFSALEKRYFWQKDLNTVLNVLHYHILITINIQMQFQIELSKRRTKSILDSRPTSSKWVMLQVKSFFYHFIQPMWEALMPIVTANTSNHQVSTRLNGNYLSLPTYTWPSSTLLILQPTKSTTKKVSIYKTRNKSQGGVLVFCDWHLCWSELWFIKPCHHSNHNPKHEETNNNHPECRRVGLVCG